MTLRFFFDECTDEDIARALIALGVDVVSVSGLNRKGLPDKDQFDYAQQEKRVFYTIDRGFFKIAADYLTRGQTFCGLVFHAPGAMTKREIIDSLVLLDGVLEPADMENHIEYL